MSFILNKAEEVSEKVAISIPPVGLTGGGHNGAINGI